MIRGRNLSNGTTLAFSDDIWGNGILWDGFQSSLRSGRVWSSPFTWQSSFVWPARLEGAQPVTPLYGDPELTELTDPVPGDADPTPLKPDFTLDTDG